MKNNLFTTLLMLTILFSSSLFNIANAGYVIANNDEWTLTNTGYQQAGYQNTDQFVSNVTNLFSSNKQGNFLAYSANFGLTQSSLSSSMANNNHDWTINKNIDFTVEKLSQYDGVFFSGYGSYGYPEQEVILEYVSQGGNVYIAAGTGNGGATKESNGWNTVLAAVGLAFDNQYNHVIDILNPSGSDPLLKDVNGLYFNNGNTIIDNDLNNETTNGVILLSKNNKGLIGMGSYGHVNISSIHTPNNASTSVPGPLSLLIFGIGMISVFSRYVYTNNK